MALHRLLKAEAVQVSTEAVIPQADSGLDANQKDSDSDWEALRPVPKRNRWSRN